MNIVRHLTEPFLALASCVLRFQAFCNVTENHHVPTREVVGRRGVSHRNLRAARANQLDLSALAAAFEKDAPLSLELLGVGIELRKGMADENSRRRSEESKGRWIRVQADSLIVENQDAVESMVVDGSKFTLRLVNITPSYKPSTNVEKCDATEGEQDGRQSGNGKIRGIDQVP